MTSVMKIFDTIQDLEETLVTCEKILAEEKHDDRFDEIADMLYSTKDLIYSLLEKIYI